MPFAGGLWVILGGKDKGSDYTLLRAPLAAKAHAALLIGAAAAKIAGANRWRRAHPRCQDAGCGRARGLCALDARRYRPARSRLRQLRPVRKLRASRARIQRTWYSNWRMK